MRIDFRNGTGFFSQNSILIPVSEQESPGRYKRPRPAVFHSANMKIQGIQCLITISIPSLIFLYVRS